MKQTSRNQGSTECKPNSFDTYCTRCCSNEAKSPSHQMVTRTGGLAEHSRCWFGSAALHQRHRETRNGRTQKNRHTSVTTAHIHTGKQTEKVHLPDMCRVSCSIGGCGAGIFTQTIHPGKTTTYHTHHHILKITRCFTPLDTYLCPSLVARTELRYTKTFGSDATAIPA